MFIIFFLSNPVLYLVKKKVSIWEIGIGVYVLQDSRAWGKKAVKYIKYAD